MIADDEDSWDNDSDELTSDKSDVFYRSAETLFECVGYRQHLGPIATPPRRTERLESGVPHLRSRNARRKNLTSKPEELIKHQETMCRTHTYKFAARCVAFPISQQLFNKPVERRDNYLIVADLELIERNCLVYLTSKYPGTAFTEAEWQELDNGSDSDYDNCDVTMWWLRLQVRPGGRAFKLVMNSPHERYNRRFSKKSLLEITMHYAKHVLMNNGLKLSALRRILQEDILHDLKMVTAPERELNPDYYYDLLKRLLDINQSQHAAIYNDSKLGDMNEQIARIRSEVEDRASTLFSRRYSLQFKSDEEAVIATDSKQKTFNDFEKLVRDAVSGTGSVHPAHCRKAKHTGHVSGNNYSTNVNEFKIRFSVGVISGLCPDKVFPYFCKLKCGSTKSHCRTNTALVVDGQLEFYSFEDFKTTDPNPSITIKLTRAKESLFNATGGLTITKKTVKIDLRQSHSCCSWRFENMKLMESNYSMDPQQDLKLKFKYEVEISESIRMLGHLYCEGCTIWKEPKVRFFILYEREINKAGQEIDREVLQEFSESRDNLHAIPLLTEYDVTIQTRDPFQEENEEYSHGFTLFKPGEEIKFYAMTEEDKSMWVDRLFKCTQQTTKPDDEPLPTQLHGSPRPPNPRSPNPIDSSIFFAPSDGDIRANQGQHSKYFKTLANRMITFCMETYRPLMYGKLPKPQEDLLLEYKIRYDITDAFYAITRLEAYTSKVEMGAFVNPQIIQDILWTLKDPSCVKTMPEEDIILEASERLYESMKFQLRFIFDLFPYDLEEKQLVGYFLLIKELATDCDRAEELGEIKQLTMDCFEQSMYYEYLKIAPTDLYENIDEFISPESSSLNEDLLSNLMYKCIDFIQHFHQFFQETFRFLNIDEEDISQLLECFLSLFDEDLTNLASGIGTNDKTFQMFSVLNTFCYKIGAIKNGKFHTQSLHSAFLVHVLLKVERMSNEIIAATDSNLTVESWEPVDTIEETEPYKCKSFMLLSNMLDGLSIEIERLKWPNLEFRQLLDNMVRDKTSQIRLKYAEVAEQRITQEIFHLKQSGVPQEVYHIFNFLLSLHTEVPSKLDKSIRIAVVTVNCMKMISGVLLSELNIILGQYEWDSFISVVCFSSMSNKMRKRRVDMFFVYLRKNLESLHEVHPRFKRAFYEYLYKLHMIEMLSWLEQRKRFCEVQLEMIVHILDETREAFTNHVREEALNIKVYHSVKRVLDFEEIRLIGCGAVGLGASDISSVLCKSVSSVASFCSSSSRSNASYQ